MMVTLAIILALQAAPAAPQQVALNMEAPAAAAIEASAPATEEVAPARKRVCRTTIDNRTGLIAKQRKVCRFVDGPADTTN